MNGSIHFDSFANALAQYGPGVHQMDPGATDDEILRAEKALSMKIPSIYRDFLRKYNGGSAFRDAIVFLGTRRDNASKETDLVTVNKRKWPRMPSSCFVIAEYSFGDQICILPETGAPNDYGIGRWDHETAQFKKKWPSLEAWLDDTFDPQSSLFNRDGSYKQVGLAKLISELKRKITKGR